MGSLKNGVHITSRGPYICCFSGRKFYPLSVKAKDIDIEDIAHSLSKQCRFAGHTNKFYSVAEHCVRVSWELGKESLYWGLLGLLHDDSEAYLIDVPKPLKTLADFLPYRKIEKTVQDIIYKKYLSKVPDILEQFALDNVDNLLLATEARDLMNNPFWCKKMKKLKEKIKPWGPEKAKRKFMQRFKELTNG